jgi:hypothetical protein
MIQTHDQIVEDMLIDVDCNNKKADTMIISCLKPCVRKYGQTYNDTIRELFCVEFDKRKS